MNPTSPKAVAGAGAAGLAGYIITAALWALKSTPPPEVVAALTAILGALLSFGAAYMAPHSGQPQNGTAADNGAGGQPGPAPAPVVPPAPVAPRPVPVPPPPPAA